VSVEYIYLLHEGFWTFGFGFFRIVPIEPCMKLNQKRSDLCEFISHVEELKMRNLFIIEVTKTTEGSQVEVKMFKKNKHSKQSDNGDKKDYKIPRKEFCSSFL